MTDNNYFVNSSLSLLSDDQTYITTTTSPQEIYFQDTQKHTQFILNSIIIECAEDSPSACQVKFNNENSYVYIGQGMEESVEGINILKLTIISPVSTKFKFKGLSSQVSGGYFTI